MPPASPAVPPMRQSQRYKPHDAYGVFTMRLQAMSVSSVSENMPPMTGTILSTVYFAVLKETPSIEAPAIPFERADAKEDDKSIPSSHLTMLSKKFCQLAQIDRRRKIRGNAHHRVDENEREHHSSDDRKDTARKPRQHRA